MGRDGGYILWTPHWRTSSLCTERRSDWNRTDTGCGRTPVHFLTSPSQEGFFCSPHSGFFAIACVSAPAKYQVCLRLVFQPAGGYIWEWTGTAPYIRSEKDELERHLAMEHFQFAKGKSPCPPFKKGEPGSGRWSWRRGAEEIASYRRRREFHSRIPDEDHGY